MRMKSHSEKILPLFDSTIKHRCFFHLRPVHFFSRSGLTKNLLRTYYNRSDTFFRWLCLLSLYTKFSVSRCLSLYPSLLLSVSMSLSLSLTRPRSWYRTRRKELVLVYFSVVMRKLFFFFLSIVSISFISALLLGFPVSSSSYFAFFLAFTFVRLSSRSSCRISLRFGEIGCGSV